MGLAWLLAPWDNINATAGASGATGISPSRLRALTDLISGGFGSVDQWLQSDERIWGNSVRRCDIYSRTFADIIRIRDGTRLQFAKMDRDRLRRAITTTVYLPCRDTTCWYSGVDSSTVVIRLTHRSPAACRHVPSPRTISGPARDHSSPARSFLGTIAVLLRDGRFFRRVGGTATRRQVLAGGIHHERSRFTVVRIESACIIWRDSRLIDQAWQTLRGMTAQIGLSYRRLSGHLIAEDGARWTINS